MDTLKENVVKLLSAGFKITLESDGNTFTATLIDDDDSATESNIYLPELIESLVSYAIIESKSTIINAKRKLKHLDCENKHNWKEV